MSKLKDLSNMRISSVTDQYDAAERLVKEVIRDKINCLTDGLERTPDASWAFHIKSDIDLLAAWLRHEKRMVAERTVYDD